MGKVLTKTTPVIFHYRKEDKPSKGGAITVVYNPETYSFGTAVCSYKDNFCRKIGIKIATGRAKVNPSIGWDEKRIKENGSVVYFDEVKRVAGDIARNYDRIYRKGIFA